MDIMDFIIDECTYERLQQYGDYEGGTFSEFITWNRKCIADLGDEDRAWIMSLCKRIKNNLISLMDSMYCMQHDATNIYFDTNKRLCIVNPH